MSVLDHKEFFSTKSSFGDVFKKASRHSQRVSILKFFLPLFVFVIAFVFSWFTFFFTPVASDSVNSNDEGNGITKLTMFNPKLESYTGSRESYWLKAEKVFQDRTHSKIIGLQNITAEALVGKQERVFLNAQEGVYDNTNSCLRLNKPFTITTNDGMIAQFMAAKLNFVEGKLSTDQRIDIQRAGLHLAANALEIREKGQNIYFHGGVHLVINKK
ncbi:LPS export ABC transporter periplasmic protein LptC [Bartonella doshiae]|uniref:Uncharacterized protein conserved in bacteria n=2 Tax=Bartonella doshiae TaxID=33044 RepID=A0A380ZHM9_BARDO|nr:LPS export ABC transporter periplasmic protein LptC [Bartonella doshiae]EJF80380.1 hypothetical protein MCS_01030 [Bartonella doshiae NCTC 12862 = ATCC 700133]MBB6158685.1 lipopolysaccharide export system protein LptC [Bartonella doshiae]SUV46010.1 Uncharacterized protein conserved in bacteria [Bartonella doshiae]